MIFTFRSEAADDISGARAWYEEQRTGLGEEFIDSVEHALDLVRQLPRSFPLVAPEVHRALLRRFPYALYFRLVGSERIEIIACPSHASLAIHPSEPSQRQGLTSASS